jgi:hypothetical protein
MPPKGDTYLAVHLKVRRRHCIEVPPEAMIARHHDKGSLSHVQHAGDEQDNVMGLDGHDVDVDE